MHWTNGIKARLIIASIKLNDCDSAKKDRAVIASLTNSKVKETNGAIIANHDVLTTIIGGESLLIHIAKLDRPKIAQNFVYSNIKEIDINALLAKSKQGDTCLELLAEQMNIHDLQPIRSIREHNIDREVIVKKLVRTILPEALVRLGDKKFRKELSLTKITNRKSTARLPSRESFAVEILGPYLEQTELADILQDKQVLQAYTQSDACKKTHPKVFAMLPQEQLLAESGIAIINLAKTGNLHLAPRECIEKCIIEKDPETGCTLVHFALETGCLSAIPANLLTSDALEEKNNNGETPLIYAYSQGFNPYRDGRISAQVAESMRYLEDKLITLPPNAAPEGIVTSHNSKVSGKEQLQDTQADTSLSMF